MSCARWLSATVALLAVGCSESPRDFPEGAVENAESAGRRTIVTGDQSTDAPVVLLGADAGTTATHTDAGLEDPPAEAPPQDASVVEQPATDDDREPDDDHGNSHDAGSMTEPEPPPDDDDNGGLVGTVCDLLGGLLCPVGLLCVDGSCQMPD